MLGTKIIIFSSDYEYDSDEEEDFDQLPPGGVNETLSKKKYCQSFKLFHQIFDSVKQFEGFQRSVSKMKKYVFGVIFALFLEALPEGRSLDFFSSSSLQSQGK